MEIPKPKTPEQPPKKTCSFQKQTEGYDTKEDKITYRFTCSLSLGGVECIINLCPLQNIIANLKLLQHLESMPCTLTAAERSRLCKARPYKCLSCIGNEGEPSPPLTFVEKLLHRIGYERVIYVEPVKVDGFRGTEESYRLYFEELARRFKES